MKILSKKSWVVACLALGGVALGGLALANPGPCGPEGPRNERMLERMKVEQQRLHDDLKLNPEQEKAWQKLQESMPMRAQQDRKQWAEMQKLTAPERAEKMLAWHKAQQEPMQAHLTALKAFYDQLTPEQKKRFDEQGQQRRPRQQASE